MGQLEKWLEPRLRTPEVNRRFPAGREIQLSQDLHAGRMHGQAKAYPTGSRHMGGARFSLPRWVKEVSARSRVRSFASCPTRVQRVGI